MISERRPLVERLRRIGAERLLDRGINWENMVKSANPPGAMTPENACETLTRQAIRRKEARRRAFRSGLTGLRAALA